MSTFKRALLTVRPMAGGGIDVAQTVKIILSISEDVMVTDSRTATQTISESVQVNIT